MDRTMIDTYRAEEKVLSEQIHRKLETLMLIHQTNFEFRKMCTEGIFLKPNQKAFFHVMHFLLMIFDPNEFRRRFYWPIVDKKSEGIFRTSVVEYMTYLNKKYNLQWKYQWNYLVQMPGGSKFLTFLIDLADFITHEIVKQKERYLNDKNYKLDEPFDKSVLMKLKLRHKCFKINALHYVESLESITKKYKENSGIIRNQLNNMSKNSPIGLDFFLNENNINDFSEFSDEILKEKICNQLKNVTATEENLKIIQNNIENFEMQRNNIEYDTGKLIAATNEFFPNEEIISKNEIDFEVLSRVFIKICPVMDNLLTVHDERYLGVLNFEESELSKFNTEVLKLDNDVKTFLFVLNNELQNLKKSDEIVLENKMDMQTNSHLLPKLMFTPPILNFNDTINFRRRLPLMQSVSTPTQDEFTFANNQTTIIFPQSALRKLKDNVKNISKVQNQSNSKIIDPSTFLRSLKKTCKGKSNLRNKEQNSNLTQLVKKWKEQEESFYEEEHGVSYKAQQMGQNDEKKNEIDSEIFKMSLTMRKNLKLIETPLSAEKSEFVKRKLFLDIPQKLNQIIKGSPSFLKQKSPLDLKRMSTSPSGRLDPLVKYDKNNFSKTIIIDCESAELENSLKFITEEIVDTSLILNTSDVKDSIFNVSDTILKDISM